MMDFIPPRGDTHPDSPWYVGDEEMERRKSGIDKYDIFGDRMTIKEKDIVL